MNGSAHFTLGVGSTLAGLYAFSAATGIPVEPSTYWITGGMAAVGSLAPDIDHPRAMISHRIPLGLLSFGFGLLSIAALFAVFPALSSLLRDENALEAAINGYNNSPIAQLLLPIGAGAFLVGLSLFVTSMAVSDLFGHRGATHSLFVAIIATSLVIAGSMFIGIAWWVGLFFGWGYLTHLLADTLTEMGLPDLFWPMT